MLYSKYYSKAVVGRQKATTQADQLQAAIAKKKAVEAEIAALQGPPKPEAKPEPTPEKVEAQAEPEKVAEAAPEPEQVDVEARAKELVDGNTVPELKAMADALGVTLSPRAREASIARAIANKEQENANASPSK